MSVHPTSLLRAVNLCHAIRAPEEKNGRRDDRVCVRYARPQSVGRERILSARLNALPTRLIPMPPKDIACALPPDSAEVSRRFCLAFRSFDLTTLGRVRTPPCVLSLKPPPRASWYFLQRTPSSPEFSAKRVSIYSPGWPARHRSFLFLVHRVFSLFSCCCCLSYYRRTLSCILPRLDIDAKKNLRAVAREDLVEPMNVNDRRKSSEHER